MLSHNYRIKLEEICGRIAKCETVELNEIIWCEKLAKANQHAAKILRQARRKAENPEMTEDSLDGFLNALDIGSLGHERRGIRGFDSPDEIAEWFSRDRDGDDEENRRRRD
jgi:hypothetical protein